MACPNNSGLKDHFDFGGKRTNKNDSIYVLAMEKVVVVPPGGEEGKNFFMKID
jgi:hypothetical protein